MWVSIPCSKHWDCGLGDDSMRDPFFLVFPFVFSSSFLSAFPFFPFLFFFFLSGAYHLAPSFPLYCRSTRPISLHTHRCTSTLVSSVMARNDVDVVVWLCGVFYFLAVFFSFSLFFSHPSCIFISFPHPQSSSFLLVWEEVFFLSSSFQKR